MKKYFLLSALAVATLFTVTSCVDRTDVIQQQDNDTYPVMRDVTASFTSANNYTITQGINIPTTDVVLVYRNYNSNTSGGTVWQLLPKTYYLSNNRELDYNFMFDTSNIEIYVDPSFDLATASSAEANQYLNNQRFRIVLIPASQGKVAGLDYSDYNAVVKFYNLKEPK